MNNETQQRSPRCWTTRRDEKRRRLQLISSWMSGLLLPKVWPHVHTSKSSGWRR